MPYYNPSKWIASDDSLIPEVEQKVKPPKVASSRRLTTRKAFLPPNTLELDVVIKATKETLRLTEWQDTLGKVFINLAHDRRTLRKGHLNEMRWHQNPKGRAVRPPHHMHFPTTQYPNLDLERASTCAHPILGKQRVSFIDALRGFCGYVNIELHGVSVPLLRR